MTWPITWPKAVNAEELDLNIRRLCELYAVACMTALTLHRVGGDPVRLIPGRRDFAPGQYVWFRTAADLAPLGQFYAGAFQPSEQDLQHTYTVRTTEAVRLPGPVGHVSEVVVDGKVIDPAAYRVEDGQYLVRIDGQRWPAGGADGFVITYLNSYPVDEMGSHAAGVMAAEWLKLITRDKGCRLPPSATSITRQGITIEVAGGMFPGNVTGIPEIDAYLMLFNPHSLRVPPRVYSLDLPQDRQVWHA